MNKTIMKSIIATLVGLVISFSYFLSVGLFGAESAVVVFKILSNGFFIAAVLLLGFASLMWAGGEGIFDGLSYSLYVVFGRFTKLGDRNWHPEHYGDYRDRKTDKRQDLNLRYMFLVGTGYLVLATIMLIVFNSLA